MSSKAIAGKTLSFWLAEVACKEAEKPSATQLTKLVASCAWTYMELLKKIESWPLLLTAEQAEYFFKTGQSHLMMYSQLRKQSSEQDGRDSINRSLWQLMPKHHYFQHLLFTVREERVNPAYFTLLCAESFVGTIARMARLSHRSTLSKRVIEKYLVKLAIVVRDLKQRDFKKKDT